MNHEEIKKDLEHLEPEATDGSKIMGGGFGDGFGNGEDTFSRPEDPIQVGEIKPVDPYGGFMPEEYDPEMPGGEGPTDPSDPITRIRYT